MARFHQEALAATAIGHEHIVEVNDMGRTPDGALFMVLEYLQGRDFADLLEKESPLPIGRVVHVVMQMCDALQAAHHKGIVHRDLKPENVFLVKRGGDPDFVKVLDFGISKMQQGETGGPRAATRTGAIMGTALYMSPEQAMGQRSVDHRTDIWALGVILYYAITGRFPFLHEAFPALILQICTDRPTPPSHLRSDVDAALEAVVLRCLEKDPAARPQSCAELITALAPFRHLTAVMPSTRFSAPAPAPGASSPPSTPLERRAPDAGAAAFAQTQAAASTGPLIAAGDTTSVPTTSHVRAATSRSRLPIALGAGAIAVAATVAIGVALSSSSGTEPPSPDVAAPEPVRTVAPTDEPETSARPQREPPSIEFVVSPSEAAVLIDGRPVAPSEDGSLRRAVDADDPALHELRVEARGFRARVEDLRLSYGQRVVIALDPGTGVDDRRGTSATAAPAADPAAPHRGRSARGEHPAQPASAGTVAADPVPGTTATGAGAPVASATERPTETGAAPRESGAAQSAATDPAPEGVVVPPPPRALKRVRVP